MIKEGNKILSRFFENVVKILGICVCALLLALCVTNKVFITLNKREHAIFLKQNWIFYVCLFGSILVIFLCKYLLYRVSEKRLFWICAGVCAILGAYIIFNSDASMRYDTQYVFEAALQFNKGDFSYLDVGRYINYYPHQLGLVAFEQLCAWFSPNPKFLAFVNLNLVIVINYYVYKITDVWFGNNETINKYSIVGSFLFLPQLFMILFTYGTIPGWCAAILAVYFLTMYLKEGNKRFFAGTLITSAVTVLLRNNYMICVLAMVCICIIEILKNKRFSTGLLTIGLLLALVLPGKVVAQSYEIVSGKEIGSGKPKLLWVAMGMQESDRASGWYNGYNDEVYINAGYDSDIASQIAKEDILKRTEYFIENPDYTLDFYMEKIISTWCDPMFQSIWSGPLEVWDQQTYTDLLKDLYSGGVVYKILSLGCNVLIVDILLFTIIQLVGSYKERELKTNVLFPIIFLIGGVLFHILWETKSQYVYVYIFGLIPLAASGIYNLQSRWELFLVQNKKH